MIRFLFVGERQSQQAAKIGATWENGRMAARQLHDALRALNIDPLTQRYVNLWRVPGVGPTNEPINPLALHEIEQASADGYTIVGMGQLVSHALTEHGIAHLLMIHPAARGAIRKKERYTAHVEAVLGGAR